LYSAVLLPVLHFCDLSDVELSTSRVQQAALQHLDMSVVEVRAYFMQWCPRYGVPAVILNAVRRTVAYRWFLISHWWYSIYMLWWSACAW